VYSIADEERLIIHPARLNRTQFIAGTVFILAALYIASLVPTIEIAWVSAILLLTIYLFAFEVVGVDVAATTIMVLLGLTSLLAPLMGLEHGLVDSRHLFDGFSSNAVISIIAVMIIGAGLDRTGIMSKVATHILKIGGTRESRIIPIISGSVGIISARSGLPMSRLLMPMGFCAILGGTVTMVGSSPLILLNDLILTSNKALPPEQQMDAFSLFSVTPVGLVLVAVGVLYFVMSGRFVLPSAGKTKGVTGSDTMEYFQDIYGLNYRLFEVVVPQGSVLVGKQLDDVEHQERIRVIAALRGSDDLRVGPGSLARDIGIEIGTVLGILGSPENVKAFAMRYGLELRNHIETFTEALAPSKAGIGEIVIPPGSTLIGKSARDVWMRKTYGIAMVALHRNGETLREGEGIRDLPLQAGDTMVVHTSWDALTRLEKDRNFVVVTTEFPHEEELRPHKLGWALLFFVLALSLVLFTDVPLSVALLTGAIGMVLSGVLSIEEAYQAVSWRTVFLLASLIPLGLAVETSGTAKWIAEQTIGVVGHMPVWVILGAVAVLATFFTLVMSNVGATVLLVPLAVNIAIGVGADPAMFAITVALATSNSFLIPTHQVNALIMGPGGYRVPDFIRAGGIMTILFLVVLIVMMNLMF
jgi:di/tricarboxylate transporter